MSQKYNSILTDGDPGNYGYGVHLSTSYKPIDQSKVCRLYVDGWNTELRTPAGFLPSKGDALGDLIEGGQSIIISSNPYIRFMVDSINLAYQESVMTMKNFTAGFATYVFGQEPPVMTFSGTLLNTDVDKWSETFLRLYDVMLRAPKLAELSLLMKKEFQIVIKYQEKTLYGSIISLTKSTSAQNETAVRFNFQFLVKKTVVNWIASDVASTSTAAPPTNGFQLNDNLTNPSKDLPASRTDILAGDPVNNSANNEIIGTVVS